MTVKEAMKHIDEAEKMIKTLEAALSVLGSDDYDETIGISQNMALIMIDICQDYRDMMLGEEVNVNYPQKTEMPFNE